MKRKLVTILTLCVLLCASIIGLNACSQGHEQEHEHRFNQRCSYSFINILWLQDTEVVALVRFISRYFITSDNIVNDNFPKFPCPVVH